MTGWIWPLDGVQRFFEDLWNWISTAATNAVSVVSGWVWDAANWVKNRLTDAGNWLRDRLIEARDAITGALGGLWNSITGALSGLWNSISGAVGGAITSIGNALTAAKDALAGVVGGAVTSIGGALTAAKDSLVSGISGLSTTIGSTVSGAVTSLNSSINAMGGAVWQWMQDAMANVAKALGEGLKGFWDWMVSGLGNLANAVGGFLNKNVVQPLSNAVQGFVSWATAGLNSLMAGLVNLFKSPIHSSPDEAFKGAVGALGSLALATLGVSVPFVAGELVHPLKNMGLGQLSAVLYDMAGFGKMSGLIVQALALPTWVIPLQNAMNWLARPTLPPTMLADRMYLQGNLNEQAWKDVYRYSGWSDDRIDAWQRTMHTEPAQRTLISMLDDPQIPEAWVRGKLSKLGFTAADQDVMIGYKQRKLTASLTKSSINDERTTLRAVLKRQVKAGRLTLEGFKTELAGLKFSAEEIDLSANALQRELDTVKAEAEAKDKAEVEEAAKRLKEEERQERIKLQVTLYSRGKTTLEQFKSALKGEKVSDTAIEEMATRLTKEVKEVVLPDFTKDERTALRTALVSRFREGYMTMEALKAELVKADFTPDEIALTAQRAQLEYDTDWRKDLMTGYKAAFAKGEVNEEQLYNLVKSIVPDLERAKTLVQIEQLKKLAKPKTTA